MSPLRVSGSSPLPGRSRNRSRLGAVILLFSDVVAVLVTMAALRTWTTAGGVHATAVVLFLTLGGSYRHRFHLNVLDHAPALMLRLFAASFVVVVWAIPFGASERVLLQALCVPLAVLLVRVPSYALVRELRARGHLVEPVVIVGGGAVATELARQIRDRPECGLAAVGYVDDPVFRLLDIPHLGSVTDLEAVLRTYRARRVIVAFPAAPEHELVGVLRVVEQLGADMAIVPRFFEVGPNDSAHGLDEIRGIPLWPVHPLALSSPSWRLKRFFDVVVATLLLVLTAPLLAGAAFAVWLTSSRPVLFRQQRIGQRGRPFQMLKLRSLTTEADTNLDSGELSMTPVGRFLRRTNIDELPQLWNVLRGDMALIGPRPELPHLVEFFGNAIPGYQDRHRVPVGISGLAQVNGVRGDLGLAPIAERARFDNRYIEQWSLWRDFVLVLRTVLSVITKGSA
ncbi:MAG: exopolysaccharide biosynthesis polyprenyl glycosylphosphotransferase [Actinomycetota bacterium]|nr:exopolysaccharide biosynthesis polyprenyl glycosylphosphotransferase [Actinomycetota bacterium]